MSATRVVPIYTADDLEKTVAWYRDVFGAQMIADDCDERLDARRSVLGAAQETWLLQLFDRNGGAKPRECGAPVGHSDDHATVTTD